MEKYGFTLVTEKTMPELDGVARLWKHANTGAEVLSILNKDENKCFGVSFRTPPKDSTGVAHIMEHSVLCGSDKYPVREPFVELLKGSLQTFLNAFTFPDKTCYPVASANLQDFYNLIDVYLDAVFHPRISEDIFRQEGWHIEAVTEDQPWIYKGVVFNEMKGSYSSPDSLLAEKSQQALFPDMLYSLDSGGNPEEIPNLTYADFLAFHKNYYHPSNSRFFFWGDDPEDKRLSIVAEELAGYTFQKIDSAIPLQKPLETPRTLEVPYAAGSGDQKAMFTMNWLLGERADVDEALQMEMLEHILEGLPGSPLRRALISSGLGEDVTGQGLETDLRQMFYSTGLKGIEPSALPRAETLIFDTLADLAENGIAKEVVEAAVNSVEFDLRERNSGRFPQGLVAMIQALSTWLYDGDPMAALAFEEPLRLLKERLAKGEPVFEQLIRTRFLENKHRVTVVLLPDTTLGKERSLREQQKLDTYQASLTQGERRALVEETLHLQEAQLTPDKPEDIAKIPALGVDDLPKTNTPIAQNKKTSSFCTLSHEQPTHGIGYVKLLWPVTALPKRLIPVLPMFLRSLTEMGTAQHDYSSLGASIAAKTGGINASMLCGSHLGKNEPFCYFSLSGKAVYEKLADLFTLFSEILLDPLQDRTVGQERLGQMLLETRARMEQNVQMAGHALAGTRLAARYTAAGAFGEATTGIEYFTSVRNFVEQYAKEPQALLEDFESLRKTLLSQQGFIVSATAEEPGLVAIEELANKLYATLPTSALPLPKASAFSVRSDLPKGEVFVTPSQINFVGKGCNLYAGGWKYCGKASVIIRYLRMGYLWENVRVHGGAYGAFCNLDRASGTFVCTSFRDPNTWETLEAYDRMVQFLAGFSPDATQLTQAIVGAVGDLDTYLLPNAKGNAALLRTLSGDTEELRGQMREEMLTTKVSDFKEFAEVLAALPSGDVCIIGGDAARKAAERLGYPATTLL